VRERLSAYFFPDPKGLNEHAHRTVEKDRHGNQKGSNGAINRSQMLAEIMARGFTTPSIESFPLPRTSWGRLEKNTWKLGEKKESKKATLSPIPRTTTRKTNGPRCFRPRPHAYPEQTPYK